MSDLRAVMTASYRALDDGTARFFRRLGLHPGPEFSCGAAAVLTGTPQAEARRLLDRLTRANLVERPREDRYRLHDLVRLYAVERVRAELGDAAAAREAWNAALEYLRDHDDPRAQEVEERLDRLAADG
ncbi:hypothetical protein ABZ512_05670 [Nocardiopsis dassonvillei]|uniref:hypothetical protein n=1 Tax=Nocardiopsis dassonvillei TaxID=2014 RepID=UPI0033EABFAC